MVWYIAGCFLPPLVISFIATFAMRRLAPHWGLIDRPAARKVHETPTPMGGGVAIWLAVVVPLITGQILAVWLGTQEVLPSWMPEDIAIHFPGVLERAGKMWAILGAITVLMIMGLLDDQYGIPWKWRLSVQFLIAIGLVASGIRATVFISQPWVGMVLTVVWMVVLINSLNFLDNMDGLSTGIGLIVSVMFAYIMLAATGQPRWLVGGCLLVLAGALTGFLYHNWSPAKIFMGDAGSTMIGLLLACFTVLGTFYNDQLGQRHVMLAPLCILAVPLYDITSVIIIRLMQGRSPFQPDKSHFSHRLVELGLSRKNAVLVVHFTTITTGLGALLLYQVDGWVDAMLIVSLVCCVLVIITILETAARQRGS